MIDMTGYRNGSLTVVRKSSERIYLQGAIRRPWECHCDCGNTVLLTVSAIRKCKSCGCKQHDGTHGKTKTREYQAWVDMIRRCYDPRRRNYADYGGKGVTVCDRWRESSSNFLNDMGPAPSNEHSLDRIDPTGNYEPSNCRWATVAEQNRNRRDTRKLVFRGQQLCAAEFARICRRDRHTVYRWLDRGWLVEKIAEHCGLSP